MMGSRRHHDRLYDRRRRCARARWSSVCAAARDGRLGSGALTVADCRLRSRRRTPCLSSIALPVPSAQVKSAVLLPTMRRARRACSSRSRHGTATEWMMRHFGATVRMEIDTQGMCRVTHGVAGINGGGCEGAARPAPRFFDGRRIAGSARDQIAGSDHPTVVRLTDDVSLEWAPISSTECPRGWRADCRSDGTRGTLKSVTVPCPNVHLR